jgi:uncharacterized SAM-binding protein YcdF (DUF218 family)
MRVAGRLILGLAFVSLGLDFATFDLFSVPTEAQIRGASAAVVFTGAFERVDVGLKLLDAGAVPRLYISGVNARAGILPVHFVSQFSARNPNIANLQHLAACCVEWGVRADNTLQNARDTECWLDRRRLAGPLLLITSRGHLSRAMAALSGVLPSRVLIPYPVDDSQPSVDPLRGRAFEYLKYLGTLVAVRLPWIVGAQRLYGPFAGACPEKL